MSEPRLFVYGTLQPGRLRWPHLQPFALGSRPARVTGRLYDSGQGWPAAVFDHQADELIPGTIVDLDPATASEALALLDEVEGRVNGLFTRVDIAIEAGEQAWAYQWGWPLDGLLRIDRWDRADER